VAPERRERKRIDPLHWLVILHLPCEFGYEVFITRSNGTGSSCSILEIDHELLRIVGVKTDTMRPVYFALEDIESVEIRGAVL
jgi:hypothetical protein